MVIKDGEAEEPDICDSRAAGKPNNYSFDVSDLTKHQTQLKFTNNEIQQQLLSLSDLSHKYPGLLNQA